MKAKKSSAKRPLRRAARTAKKAAPKSRKYEKNVREQVITLLRAGSATRNDLLKKGGFSAASLNIHLKALRKEKKLKTQGKRPIVFTLVGAPEPQVIDAEFEPATEAAPTPSPSRRKAPAAAGTLVPAIAPVELHEALDAVDRRLAAKHRIPEKLLTLERLAETLPAPIAAILHEIRDDYMRHTV